MLTRSAGFKTAALMSCFLALAACSKKNTPDLEAGPGGGAGIGQVSPGSKADFETNVGDRIYFIVDTVTLTPEAEDTLYYLSGLVLIFVLFCFHVDGHADERGTREYNISLSARRATATRNYLIRQGVPGNRISSIAYGKERPASLCDAEECWSQNRRAVTVITGGTN